MKREKKDKNFLHRPHYPGGPDAMKAFVRKHLKYPSEALDAKVEGVVQLRVTINDKGKVIKTEIVHSIGYGCDEEAERIVKMMIFEVPRNRGVKVKFHKKMNIHFKIAVSKETKKMVAGIQYNYKTTKPEKKQPDKPKSYVYTINVNR